ncbi:MAG TPA: CU044_2847 family protein [Thermomonospora sp.]|nr:CU044_2847 family protein [Thermomonospora sp.]
MSELLRWPMDEGSVVVEVDEGDPGFEPASLSGDGVIHSVSERFETALLSTRVAAEKALAVFRDGALRPDAVELEFGVKLNAAAGAVIAKTAGEAHLRVKLTWARDGFTGPPQEEGPSNGAGPAGGAEPSGNGDHPSGDGEGPAGGSDGS